MGYNDGNKRTRKVKMVQLTVVNGYLYVHGEILLVRTLEGDCDRIEFPFRSDASKKDLASSLFDEYEIGEIDTRTVLLPNGELFNIDNNL